MTDNQTARKIKQEIILLGSPIILGQIGYIFVAFADNIMVGRHSTDELAAASFVNNLFALAFIFGMGFAYGLTPLVSKAFTLKEHRKTGQLLRHSLTANTVVAIGITAIMMVGYLFIDRFGLPQTLLPLIKPYYILQTISLVIAIIFSAFKQFFDGIGKTALSMWVLLAANILNVIGNWLLIYGHAGLPEWGLLGAGISSLAARIFTLITLWVIFRFARAYTEERRGFGNRSDGAQIRALLYRLGLPIGVQLGVEAGSFTIAVIYVGWIGSAALAAHQIISVITTLGFMIYYGFGSATTILVSSYRALKDTEALRQVVRSARQISNYVAISVVILIIATRHYAGMLFTTDSEVVNMVAIALLPVIFYQFGDVMQIIYANALRGLEDVKFLARAAVLAHVIIAPALSYLLGFGIGITDDGWQLTAIWCAFPISLTTLGLLLRYRLNRSCQHLH